MPYRAYTISWSWLYIQAVHIALFASNGNGVDLAEAKVRMSMAGLLFMGTSIPHLYNIQSNTYRRLHREQTPEVWLVLKRAVTWVSNTRTLEAVLVNASTPFQAHSALGHPSQSPKTRHPILGLAH